MGVLIFILPCLILTVSRSLLDFSVFLNDHGNVSIWAISACLKIVDGERGLKINTISDISETLPLACWVLQQCLCTPDKNFDWRCISIAGLYCRKSPAKDYAGSIQGHLHNFFRN